jgi:hypothetical protein
VPSRFSSLRFRANLKIVRRCPKLSGADPRVRIDAASPRLRGAGLFFVSRTIVKAIFVNYKCYLQKKWKYSPLDALIEEDQEEWSH